MKLSVIVPVYKEPYLDQHINSLLTSSELGDQLEIIVVMDGVSQKTIEDPRVKVFVLPENRGMRGAINYGVSVSTGEFLMRTDSHCKFAQGCDRIMTESCQPNWIMTAKRFFLDPTTWEVMDLPPVEHEKLVIQGGVKWAGMRWPERDQLMKDQPITETMAMQGSMWVMPRSWWDKVIGELQVEGYGPLIQDSHEMIFKTWKAGGKMMLNKNTWFAHKHRSFPRSHNNGTPENPAHCDEGYKYALDTWRDYFEKEIRPKWGI